MVIQGVSLPRLGVIVPLLGVILVVGCSDSSRYPADLPYPVRKDLLITSMPPDKTGILPGPGQVEESIKTATKVLGAQSLDPNNLSSGERKELGEALIALFGSPRSPKVDLANDLDLDERTLARGSRHYRRHCLHCHGLSGDGRGPTGPWVNPHPRDYRQGWFKFISTRTEVGGAKARRVDLLRTLRVGIDGTSMPSFALLADQELEELVSYVMHLSIRGETEFKSMAAALDAIQNAERANKDRKEALAALEGGSITGLVTATATAIVEQWQDAQKSVNTPATYPEKFKDKDELKRSVGRGYQIFVGRGICITCHSDFGRQPLYQRDVWGTLVRPNNLTAGVYRGGRRPLDIYYRATRGIPPSQMPPLELLAKESERAAASREALKQPISVDFQKIPLEQAVREIEKKLKGVRLVVADKAKEPVTYKAANQPASVVLTALAAPFSSSYSIKDDGVVHVPATPKLTGDEVWDVVNFVQALPYPAMLPPDVRQKIYPSDAVASH